MGLALCSTLQCGWVVFLLYVGLGEAGERGIKEQAKDTCCRGPTYW